MKKNALVFGSSSTIGGHICGALSLAGYEVTGTFFNSPPFRPLDHVARCDITKLDQVDQVFERLKTLDVLVLSSFPFMEADPFSWNDFQETQKVYVGHMRAIWKAHAIMNNGGRVVNILGQCVRNGLPSAPHYSASFAAMHNYSKSVNGKYAKNGVISMVDVLLAAVNTREWDNTSPEIKKQYEAKMGKFISPYEVARRVMFEISCETMATELVIDGSVLI